MLSTMALLFKLNNTTKAIALLRPRFLLTVEQSQQLIRCICTSQFRRMLNIQRSVESPKEIMQTLRLLGEPFGKHMSGENEKPDHKLMLNTDCAKLLEKQQNFYKDGSQEKSLNVGGIEIKGNSDETVFYDESSNGFNSGGNSKTCSTRLQANHRISSDSYNCCVKITGPRQVQISECPMPRLQDDHVIIKMHSTGLCGSDSFLFSKGIGKVEGNDVSLGHEGAGVVVEVGRAITHLKKGDAVAIESGVPCCQCRFCKCGRYNLCETMQYTGLLSAFLDHPGSFCYKVPPSMDLELAALTDTLAQALQSCRKARIRAGSNLLILGACSRGLSTIIAARSMGADTITIVDTLDKNLRVAKKMCADNAVCVNLSMSSNEIVEKVLDTVKCRPNAVIDCCGCTNTVNIAVFAVEQGGHCVLSGCQTECANMPILSALAKQISYGTSFGSANMFPKAISLINKNRSLMDQIITHRTHFYDAQRAFELATNDAESGAIKVLIKWSRQDEQLR